MDSIRTLEPVAIFCLFNVVFVCGLYVTALSGQLSMATAAIAGTGGYLAAVLTTNMSWPLSAAVLASVIACGMLGGLIGGITLRMRDFILKLTTLAIGETMSVIAFNLDYIGGPNGFSGIPLLTDLTVAAIGATFALLVAWSVDHSRIGLAARAVRDDQLAASSMGVAPYKVRLLTFIVGSAVIGWGGALQAHYVLVVNPHDMGFFPSLTIVIFLLFGGLYSLWGPVLAAILLTTLPEVLRFTNEYRMIFYGMLITIVILRRPEGILRRQGTRFPKNGPTPVATAVSTSRQDP